MADISTSPAYLGQVATRSFFADAALSFKQQMNETLHYLRDSVIGIQVGWAGLYGSAGDEIPMPNAATITASALTQAGAVTQLKFSGAVQGTVPAGDLVLSDYTPFIGGVNELISIRSYLTAATSLVYNASFGVIGKDKMVFANSGVADQTLGGVITSTSPGSTFCYAPSCILGYTRKGSVLILLDSIPYGFSDVVSDAFMDTGYARSIGPEMAYINAAIGSSTCQAVAAGTVRNAVRKKLGLYCSAGINNGGTNDLGARTVAQVVADRTTIAGFWPAMKMFGTTITPRTTSTDSFTTVANQTTVSTGSFETKRVDFNDNYVRAGAIPGEVGYFDVADALESDRNSGKIAVGYLPGAASGVANTGDGLHFPTRGQTRIRLSGAIKPRYMQR